MYTAIVVTTLLLTITTTISASPTRSHHFSRRGLPGAYYTCTKSNFAGECSWTQPNTECHIQGSPGGIESLGPDQGSVCCLYKGDMCKDNVLKQVVFPGLATNMPDFGSFRCFTGSSSNCESGTVTGQARALTNAEVQAAGLELEDFGLLKKVETEGREEGMIGLKKGVYY